VADDDEGIRQRIAKILAADYDVIALVENGRQLVEMARALAADLAIVDISMPVLNGLEAVKQLKMHSARTKVIFFTANASPAYVRRAFQNGAAAYVLKACGAEDLPVGLRAVLAGNTFISPAIEFSEPLSFISAGA
jgi:DNA-binding NarL/FixJ family response regulator